MKAITGLSSKTGGGHGTSQAFGTALFQGNGRTAVRGPGGGRGAGRGLLSSVRVDSPEELLSFLKGQQLSQAKFSGPFFDGLRNILYQDASGNMKEAVLAFFKDI